MTPTHWKINLLLLHRSASRCLLWGRLEVSITDQGSGSYSLSLQGQHGRRSPVFFLALVSALTSAAPGKMAVPRQRWSPPLWYPAGLCSQPLELGFLPPFGNRVGGSRLCPPCVKHSACLPGPSSSGSSFSPLLEWSLHFPFSPAFLFTLPLSSVQPPNRKARSCLCFLPWLHTVTRSPVSSHTPAL